VENYYETLRQLDLDPAAAEKLLPDLAKPGTRRLAYQSAVRKLAMTKATDEELAVEVRVIGLDFARDEPAVVHTLTSNHQSQFESLDSLFVSHSVALARSLFDLGRGRLAKGMADSGIAAHRRARSEWQFVLSALPDDDHRRREALGKIAVSTASIGRWVGSTQKELERAIEYLERSISRGNTAIEAKSYLAELHEQIFLLSQETTHIESAIKYAEEANDVLSVRRCKTLKALAAEERSELFKHASALRNTVASTAIEFVQRDIIAAVTSAHLVGASLPSPLSLLVPQGVVDALRTAPPESASALSATVIQELSELQARCLKPMGRRNIVAQQMLVAVLEVGASRGLPGVGLEELVAHSKSLVELIPGDRHAQWRALSAEGELALSQERAAGVSAASSKLEWLAEREHDWLAPLATAADLLRRGSRLVESDFEQRAQGLWEKLAQRISSGSQYRRELLGGRSRVFALEDVRGDLRTQLVFKPVKSSAAGELEAERLHDLRARIHEAGLESAFAAPLPLVVVTAGQETWLVLKRSAGVVLADLPAVDQVGHLDALVQLLALATPICDARGWQSVKKSLMPSLRTLLPEGCDAFRDRLSSALPPAPAVRRRDGHPSNWLVDAAGRLVALDLEASKPAPLGFCLAQLIEDRGMIAATKAGFETRYAAMRNYAAALHIPTESLPEIESLYDWSALTRAIWVLGYPHSRRSDARHGRELLAYLSSSASSREIRSLASRLFESLSVEEAGSTDGPDVRLSRRMAKSLRHGGSDALRIDEQGWTEVAALAEELSVPESRIEWAASHTAEPRFQLLRGRVRARYGHSIQISYRSSKTAEPPKYVFHGTNWGNINLIAARGLSPMNRNLVHLASDEHEALAVARRKGPPVLLRVTTEQCSNLVQLASGTWGAKHVPPSAISLHEGETDVLLPIDHIDRVRDE
jgi:RNA:NAD 2'-phosphotransferase (TPT1/KptA family)